MYLRMTKVKDNDRIKSEDTNKSTSDICVCMCPNCGSVVQVDKDSSVFCLNCGVKMIQLDRVDEDTEFNFNQRAMLEKLISISAKYARLSDNAYKLIMSNVMWIIDFNEPVYLYLPSRTILYRGPIAIIDYEYANKINLLFELGRCISFDPNYICPETYSVSPYFKNSDYAITVPVSPAQKSFAICLDSVSGYTDDFTKNTIKSCNTDQLQLPISDSILELSRQYIVDTVNYIANLQGGMKNDK